MSEQIEAVDVAAWGEHDFDNGVAVFRYRGLMTPAAYVELSRQNAAWIAAWRPPALVMRFDRAALWVDAGEMLRRTRAYLQTERVPVIPIALVCQDNYRHELQHCAMLLAHRGIVRRVFTSSEYEQALAWAEVQGLVYLEQQARSAASAASWRTPTA